MGAIADGPAQEGEEQDGAELERADQAQTKRGIGQLEHEPRLPDGLHPRADEGDELADPEEAEVSMPEGADARWKGHGSLYSATKRLG